MKDAITKLASDPANGRPRCEPSASLRPSGCEDVIFSQLIIEIRRAVQFVDAISRAGGLRDFANPKRIYILRGDKKIPFNYKEVIQGKNLGQNIQIESGDHIVFS